jgi:hypothetical protein
LSGPGGYREAPANSPGLLFRSVHQGDEQLMDYKGIRYSLREDAPLEWWVVIHPPDATSAIEKSIKGTRQAAEKLAVFMIDKWLNPKSRKKISNSN